MIKVKQNLKKVITSGFSFLIILLLIFSGCTREVTWINLEPKSVELNKQGETFQIKAAALDKENQPLPDAILTWESSNPAVAVVDANGLITAKGSGNTVIAAISENGEKAVVQCKVAILAAIKIEPDVLTLKVGDRLELEAKALNEKNELFEDQNVGWASSDHSVAFVDDIGGVTAVAPGEATVTATTPSKGLSHIYGSAKVTVTPAE
jgi:uncharacterized protein YjdB